MKTHYHPDKLISDIHSAAENEIFAPDGIIIPIPDDERTARFRRSYQSEGGKDALLKLGDALAYQMRYREALVYYEKAMEICPDDYNVLKRCASRYISTMQFDKARKILMRCLYLNGDLWDTKYKLACISYYLGDYEEAYGGFTDCYSLCDNSGELQIAVIYWQIMCLVRIGRDIQAPLFNFREDMDIGHHFGYGAAVRLFKIGVNQPIEGFFSELCKHIYLYGEATYYKYIGKNEKARQSFLMAKALDTYFSSFVYLAILNEKFLP